MKQKFGVNELRRMYLEFFESKEHLAMKSFSLVPHNDNSLLLINAGMAPLKPYFTGQEIPPRKRVTTCQKCIRTGDIENVGKTARHLTFFEMLGNFSFGDYFKREAIAWSWEFLTKVLGLKEDRLYPSIYGEDEEAFEIWNKEIGIPAEKITRFYRDPKTGKCDNFWEHGAGPCGPCSEIYYDRGESYGCGSPDCKVGCDCDRFMEVWNNVFTQFDGDGKGGYEELEQKNIDTGMGLERLAVVMQDVDSVFDIDTMKAIRDKVCELSHGKMLGIEGTFLAELSNTVIRESKDGYPELEEKKDFIFRVLTQEEEKFHKTIDQGLAILSDMQMEMEKKGEKVLSGVEAFKLYDTYGFPIDLTQEILEEKGLSIDQAGFEAAMEEQRTKARKARKVTNYMGADATVYESVDPAVTTEFVGYDCLSCTSKVTVMTTETEITEALSDGEIGTIFVEKTPFYATMGGQNADTGIIRADGFEFSVKDTVSMLGGKVGHIGTVTKGMVKTGDTVELIVEEHKRLLIGKNHSATHLLQKALREVLGSHVEQAGSDVNADRLRFDFTHFSAMTKEELAQTEAIVNQKIAAALDVVTEVMTLEEARKTGAMALFGEKYGETVRVVRMGDFSTELCGGTHVANTSSISVFKIISESGVAAGVRRIEAYTSDAVFAYYDRIEAELEEAAALLKTNLSEVPDKIAHLQKELKALQSENESLKSKAAQDALGDVMDQVVEIKGVKVLSARADGVDMNGLRDLGDQLKEKLSEGVIVLASEKDGRVNLIAMATEESMRKGAHAGNLIKGIAGKVGGGGGGRPNMAQAGGKNPAGIKDALEEAISVIENQLA